MTQHLLLFDFDETYYKHHTTSEDIDDLKQMEDTLSNIEMSNNATTAILTGSSITSVLNKMNSINMEYKPKHVFSDLSSKMFTFQRGEYVESEKYKEMVLATPFKKEDILEIVSTIATKYQCDVKPQREFAHDATLYDFYYFSQGDNAIDLKILNDMTKYAKSKNYTMKFNKCNPLAGDPEDAYDVNFIPNNAGKLFATKFLMEVYDIPLENIIGFGDSGNDYEFLAFLKHSFVMRNSTDEMMRNEFTMSKYPYYKGIHYHISKYWAEHHNK